MSLEHSKTQLEMLGDSDLAKIIADVRDAFAKRHPDSTDIPFPYVPAQVLPQKTILVPQEEVFLPMSELQDQLDLAISEYKKRPLTPELVNKTWQTIWETWGTSIRHTFQVPPCDRTSEELAELQRQGKKVLLMPDELYERQGLELLKSIFRTGNWLSNNVSNQENNGGCIDIEMALDSPYRDTTENKAMSILKKQNRTGQRLATHIVASQFSYLLTGRFLDEDTLSCLPGSWDKNRNNKVVVSCSSKGEVYLGSDVKPKSHYPNRGLRSEGRTKKT